MEGEFEAGVNGSSFTSAESLIGGLVAEKQEINSWSTIDLLLNQSCFSLTEEMFDDVI